MVERGESGDAAVNGGRGSAPLIAALRRWGDAYLRRSERQRESTPHRQLSRHRGVTRAATETIAAQPLAPVKSSVPADLRSNVLVVESTSRSDGSRRV